MNQLQQLWIENESKREELKNALKEASNGQAWFNEYDGSVKYSAELYMHELDVTPEEVLCDAIELFNEMPENN